SRLRSSRSRRRTRPTRRSTSESARSACRSGQVPGLGRVTDRTVVKARPPRATVWDALGHQASPIEAQPRVVDGVETASFTTCGGQSYVIARSPAADSYARLDPTESELLPFMDGSRSVKELVVEYYRRHGVLALPRIAAL